MESSSPTTSQSVSARHFPTQLPLDEGGEKLVCPAIWVKLVVLLYLEPCWVRSSPIPWGRSELIIYGGKGGELVGGGGDAKFYPHPSGVYRQF